MAPTPAVREKHAGDSAIRPADAQSDIRTVVAREAAAAGFSAVRIARIGDLGMVRLARGKIDEAAQLGRALEQSHPMTAPGQGLRRRQAGRATAGNHDLERAHRGHQRPDLALLPPATLKMDLSQAPRPGSSPTGPPSPRGRSSVRGPSTGSWWTARARAGVARAGFSKEEILQSAREDPRAPGGLFDRVGGLLSELLESG